VYPIKQIKDTSNIETPPESDQDSFSFSSLSSSSFEPDFRITTAINPFIIKIGALIPIPIEASLTRSNRINKLSCKRNIINSMQKKVNTHTETADVVVGFMLSRFIIVFLFLEGSFSLN
jgi:hypothetical protein